MNYYAPLIQESVDLGTIRTYLAGIRARYFASISDETQLRRALSFARDRSMSVAVLGGGREVRAVGEEPELLLYLTNRRYSMSPGAYEIVAAAAVSLEELVTQTTEKGWQGLQWAAGLSGTLGGAIWKNVSSGNYQISQNVSSVRTIDSAAGEVHVYLQDDCHFGAGTSLFQTNSEIIWEVRLKFRPGDRDQLVYERDLLLARVESLEQR